MSMPQEKFLSETLVKYEPFQSVLEVGCGWGYNLLFLSDKYPSVRFIGIDKSAKRILKAREILSKCSNVEVQTCLAENMSFADRSFDVVFSSATLMYINKENVRLVCQKMERMAKKAIILIEHHQPNTHDILIRSRYLRLPKYWIRDYTQLFTKFKQTKVRKIDAQEWGGNWAKYGYVITLEPFN